MVYIYVITNKIHALKLNENLYSNTLLVLLTSDEAECISHLLFKGIIDEKYIKVLVKIYE